MISKALSDTMSVCNQMSEEAHNVSTTNNNNANKVFAITSPTLTTPNTLQQQQQQQQEQQQQHHPQPADSNTSDNATPPGYASPPGYYAPYQSPPGSYPPPQGIHAQPQGGYPPQGYPPPQGYQGYPPQQGYPAYPPPQQVTVVYTVPVSNQPGGAPPYSDDAGEGYMVYFEDPAERHEFIRKVYAILAIQLLVCFQWVGVCVFVPAVKQWMEEHFYLWLLAMFFYIACAIIMCCCADAMLTTNGLSIGVLIVLTFSMSFLTGAISSRYEGKTVLLAIGLTALMVLVLTVLAFQTKYDFTKWLGALYVIFLIFIVFSIFAIFLQAYIPIINLIVAFIGASLMCLFIVIDTQMLMSGKRYSLSPDSYIFGAISLFVDIVLLFIYLLRLVGAIDK